MYAKELISDIVPALRLDETGEKALSWMDFFRISHLPVIDNNNNLLGLVSDTEIYDYNLADKEMRTHTLKLFRPYVFHNQHIYDVIALAARQKLSIIPVLDEEETYAGVITAQDLIGYFGKLNASSQAGTVFKLILNKHDYSLGRIAQLIEGNDAKIISLYTYSSPDSKKLELTIKIDRTDFSAVRQTLERYEYEIEESRSENDKVKEMLNERMDEFLHYLDI